MPRDLESSNLGYGPNRSTRQAVELAILKPEMRHLGLDFNFAESSDVLPPLGRDLEGLTNLVSLSVHAFHTWPSPGDWAALGAISSTLESLTLWNDTFPSPFRLPIRTFSRLHTLSLRGAGTEKVLNFLTAFNSSPIRTLSLDLSHQPNFDFPNNDVLPPRDPPRANLYESPVPYFSILHALHYAQNQPMSFQQTLLSRSRQV